MTYPIAFQNLKEPGFAEVVEEHMGRVNPRLFDTFKQLEESDKRLEMEAERALWALRKEKTEDDSVRNRAS